MASGLRVVALVSAYNEADIIAHVVRDLVEQGVLVYLLDDQSTDGTAEVVRPLVGRGVLAIEDLGAGPEGTRSGRFDWERILRRKQELAGELEADWFIHHDADELREAPWPGVSLREAIEQVDRWGYNAIDFESVDFWPTDDREWDGGDLRAWFPFCSPSEPFNRPQIRCWRKGAAPVDLVSSGGHEARFDGRRIFPIRFLARHYPIRGQRHGERKVFAERRARFRPEERSSGWHIQYDKVEAGASFVRDPSTLAPYDPNATRLSLLLRHRGVEELEHALASARAEAADRQAAIAGLEAALASRTEEVDRLRGELAAADSALRALRAELSAGTAELARLRAEREEATAALARAEQQADRLRRELGLREAEIRRLVTAAEQSAQRVEALLHSRSWRLTRPLRAVYELVGLAGTRARGAPVPPSSRPAARRVDWGDLARTSPFSDVWGTDRGLPIDRHYITRFLARHAADIRGRVLEVKDPHYARTYGGPGVEAVDVLDVDPDNPQATIVADLARADRLAADQFDCFILTQTLHIIYDLHAALRHAARLLKPDGVLLCTIPAVSRVNYEDGGLERGDYWRLTAAAVRRLFGEVFAPGAFEITTHGNVRVCAAFLYGLAAEELDAADLAYDDPWFPLVHCIRAVKTRTPPAA